MEFWLTKLSRGVTFWGDMRYVVRYYLAGTAFTVEGSGMPRRKRKSKNGNGAAPVDRREEEARIAMKHARDTQEARRKIEDMMEEDDSPEMLEAMKDLNPKQVAMFAAWVINGGNVTKAAESVGYNGTYGRRVWNENPGFQRAKEYFDNFVMEEDTREWIELLPEAKFTLRDLLKAKDEKVRFLAAKDIVDRAEGKATSRVDVNIRDERQEISEMEMQLAFSMMHHKGMTFAQAVDWMNGHPEETKSWIRSQQEALGIASGGTEVQEAEVLPP